MDSYPHIVKIEFQKQVLITRILVFLIMVPLLISAIFESVQLLVISFLVCLFISILVFQKIYLRMHNYCPNCENGVLSENYNECRRGSMEGIKHTCSNCESKYTDGIRTNT